MPWLTATISTRAAYFKIRKKLARDGVIVRSSNYALYGDLSQRVMSCLEELAPKLEIYSIDEAFLDVYGMRDPDAFGHRIVKTVKQWTAILVSVGIAPTKTLAKIANRISKGNDSPVHVLEKPPWPLDDITVEKVWGIGRRWAKRLRAKGIGTAGDLANLDVRMARGEFNVVLERTVRELRGESFLPLEDAPPPAQHIMVSCGFSQRVVDRQYLHEAVATYATRVAEKARDKGVHARTLQVFIRTSPHEKGPRYSNLTTWTFADPAQDTLSIVKAATNCLDKLWKPNYAYQKAGVMLIDLVSADHKPTPLFDRINPASEKLMEVIDRLNRHHGRETVRVASSGYVRPWSMARQFLSPCYTTRWDDLPVARA
ncbi:MAG: DUF4113 domain-containing protein [Paracoccaceae bacterium]|nr:DUF4113 domain-containing protein [Paracoccaceae bacterium]MDE2916517.1 DUF4113 domain-containing protein [Paracoccaceae bacterium]